MSNEMQSDRILLISADSHVGLPMAEYEPYIEKKYLPLWPDVVREDEESWKLLDIGVKVKFPPEDLDIMDARQAIRSGGLSGVWDPERRIKEMDAEGVAAEVLNSSAQGCGRPWFGALTRNPYPVELRVAGARAYNRWLAEFCQSAPERFVGLAVVEPWPDMEAAVRELHWARDSGLKGIFALSPGYDTPPFWDQAWEPYFATCAELDFPIECHVGYARPQGSIWKVFEAARSKGHWSYTDLQGFENAAYAFEWYSKSLFWQLAWSGVFDRYPTLKLFFTEQRADWVPAALAYLDRRYEEGRGRSFMKLKPSEYWSRNCAVGVSSTRRHEVEMRHEIGLKTFMFATDYPHTEGTWPNTLEWLQATFSEVPETELRLMLGENALNFFGLDGDKLRALANRIGYHVEEVLGPHHVDSALIAHFDKRAGYNKPPATFDEDGLAKLFDADTQAIAARA
jgi:predicted TIM-barrel fold metal-dependent hydrolase